MMDASRSRASRVKEQRLRSSSRQTMEKHPMDHKNDNNYGCAEAFSWMANHPNRPAIAIKMPHPIRITPTGRNCPKYPARATEMRLTPDMLVSIIAYTRPIISLGVAPRSSGPKAIGMPPCGRDMRKQMISPDPYQFWKE